MRRRALLSSAAALTVSLSGCLGTVYRPLGGEVLADFGHSNLHPVDDPIVEGGLGDDNDDQYYTRLVVSPETAPTFLGAENGANAGDMQRWVDEADFETQFLLLFEARMAHEEAFHVHNLTGTNPEWTGWSTLDITLQADPARDVADEYYPDADELVCTALLSYESKSSPGAATVRLFDDAGQLQAEPFRVD